MQRVLFAKPVMDDLLRGFEEVLSDTAQLLGLEESQPVRRYEPPTRPSYAEPVVHPTDSARPPKQYVGDVPLPLIEFSIRSESALLCL